MRKQIVGGLTAAVLLTACTGSVDTLLEQDQSPAVTVEVAGTVETTAPVSSVAPTTTAQPPSTTTSTTTKPTPERTLPGDGVPLVAAVTSAGDWSYRAAEAWAGPEPYGDDGQTWTTSDAELRIRPLARVEATSAETLVSLERAAQEEFAGVTVYATDYYYHQGGQSVFWTRFDSVDADAWSPVQRYWVVGDNSMLELILVGTSADTFDEQVRLLQGVINGVTPAR